jgi:hypothetical protein
MSDGESQHTPDANYLPTRQTPTELETLAQAEPLVDWFRANAGWLSPDVQIAYGESSGFHLRAIRPLGSSVIVTCPIKLTLSYLNLDRSQSAVKHLDSPLGKYLGVLPNHVLTRLLLIEQRDLAKKGEGMTSSVWFDDDDMQCLAGTNLAAATRSTLAILTEEWEHVVEVLGDANLPIPGLLDL